MPAAPSGSARDAAGPGSAPGPRSTPPAYPVVGSVDAPGPNWRPVVTIRGATAAWISLRDGVTLLRFDQRLVRLALHAGSTDPGPGSSAYGDAVVGAEQHRLVAAFNGGFRLNTNSGGWLANGHTAVPLTDGLASIVTYRDGASDIGAWHAGVPSGQAVTSVRQNLHLLVDGGLAAANVDSCLKACWGATLGGRLAVARSAIGITPTNMLVWAGVASATPATLARALIDGGAVRAAELDINPAWVAGYLYHHGSGAMPIPVVPGQLGGPGRFLTPYSRDFFSIIQR